MRLRGVSEEGEDVLEYLPKLEEAFKNVGLEIRKDEDTFKSTYEIMSDLASIWGELTDVQRAHMAELTAGKRQGNIVMAMMTNYKDMQDSLTTALNSTNSALIENEKYMESIEAKSAQFKNTVMGKWQEALNSDVIKNFVVAMTTLVEVLGNTEVIIGLLTTAFLIWKGEAITTSIVAMVKFIATIKAANISLLTMSTITQGLTKAMQLLTVTMARNPLGLLAVAATTAIVGFRGLTTATKKHREEQQKQIETSQNQIQTLKEQKSGLEELSKEYESLKNKENITTEEKKRLLEIQKELVENYDVSATGINLEGKAYTDSVEAIKLRTLALEEELKAEQDLLEFKVKASDKQVNKEIKKAISLRDKAKKRMEEYQTLIDGNKGSKSHNLSQLEDWTDIYNREQKKIYELSKNKQKYLEYDAQETIKTLESEGKKMSDAAKLVVSEFTKALALEPGDIEDQQELLRNFIDTVSNSELDFLIEKYDNFVSAINSGDLSKDNAEGLKKTSEEIDKLIYSLTKGKPSLKEFAINFAALYPPIIDAKNALDAANDSAKEIDFDSITDELKFLYKVLDELSKKDGLSSSSLEKILSEYPQLFAYMNDEIELRKQIQSMIKDYEEQQIEAFLNTKLENGKTRREMLEIDEEYFNNVIKGNAEFLDIIHKAGIGSVEGFKNIAEAKKRIETALVKDLSGIWKEYFLAIAGGSRQAKIDLDMDLMRGNAKLKANARKVVHQLNAYNDAINQLDRIISKDIGGKLRNVNLGNISSPSSAKSSPKSSSSSSSSGDEYATDQYAKSLAQLDKQLESSKYWQSLVTEASADYRKELTTQIKLIKKKQNLAHKEAERMRSLLKTAKRGTQAYDEYENKILELQKNWTSWQSEINDLTFNRVNSQLVDFDNYLESLEHRLELSKTKMQEYKDDTDEYNNSLKEQIDLTYAIIHQLIAKQQYVRLEMQNTILNRKQQEELLKVYRQIEKELLKYRLSLLDQIKSSREKLADELINAVKKGYETQKELEEAQINHSLKLAEEAHEKKINLLDEELEKYNEMIDGILDANDRLWETDDYEKKLKEEQEERNKLAQDLMLAQSLSLSDPTRDGKIKTATEALAEQDKKIKELMQERDRKLTRQHLQDLKDKKQKEVDATKKAEDKKLELIKKETEEELKLINWKYEKLLNNDKYYDDLRTQIIEGSYNNIQNIIGRILDDLESRNAVATRKIGVSWQNVLNAIYNAQKAINSIGKNLDLEKEITDEIDNIDNSRIVAVGSYLAEKGYQVGWDYDKEMLTVNGQLMDTHGLTFELNEKGWKTHYGTPAIIDQKLKQIGMFGAVPVGEYISQKGYTVGWDYDNQLITVDGRWLGTDGFTATTNEKGWKTHYGTPELIDKKLKDIGLYHEGGIVGSNMPYESKLVDKLFNVEPNERVVKALIGEVYTPPKNILDNFMPNMKMLVNKLTPQVAIAGTGDTYNNFDVNINIDKLNGVKNSGETIAKVFTDEVKNKMKKKGIYRG